MKRTLLLIFTAMFALAVPASAHVTVTAPNALRGGSDVEISFRVPTEEEQPTVAIAVQLPTATPIAGVDVQAVQGWTSTTTTTKLAKPITTDDGEITEAVTEVSWKATAGGIPPGEFGEFTLLAGQLPDTSSLTFRALQTYRDGSVVRWIETASPGSSAEPDHPAPVLTLSSPPSTPGRDHLPIVLSIVAPVLAAGALGLTVLRWRRS